MLYYLKIIDGKETAIIACESFIDAVNTRTAFINYNCNLIITIESEVN